LFTRPPAPTPYIHSPAIQSRARVQCHQSRCAKTALAVFSSLCPAGLCDEKQGLHVTTRGGSVTPHHPRPRRRSSPLSARNNSRRRVNGADRRRKVRTSTVCLSERALIKWPVMRCAARSCLRRGDRQPAPHL
jgi:hypothetical protein